MLNAPSGATSTCSTFTGTHINKSIASRRNVQVAVADSPSILSYFRCYVNAGSGTFALLLTGPTEFLERFQSHMLLIFCESGIFAPPLVSAASYYATLSVG